MRSFTIIIAIILIATTSFAGITTQTITIDTGHYIKTPHNGPIFDGEYYTDIFYAHYDNQLTNDIPYLLINKRTECNGSIINSSYIMPLGFAEIRIPISGNTAGPLNHLRIERTKIENGLITIRITNEAQEAEAQMLKQDQ